MRTSDTLSGSLVVPLVGGGSRTGAPRDKSTPTLGDNSVIDSPMVLYYHPMVVLVCACRNAFGWYMC